MRLADYKLDESRAEWFEIDDARFLIASSGTRAWNRALIRAQKKHSVDSPRAKPEAWEKALNEALAEVIVLDWQNLFLTDSDPFLYSKENCLKLLTDYRVIRDWIAARSQDLERFLAKESASDTEAIKRSPQVDLTLREELPISGGPGGGVGGSGGP